MPLDPDLEPEAPARSHWRAWLLALAVVVVVGVAAAWLWQRYDPFVSDRPDMREAKNLLDSARKRPLTDEEFERVIALLEAETPAAQLSAVATLEAEGTREPARRERAIAALERCGQSAPPTTRWAAETAVVRMKAPSKRP